MADEKKKEIGVFSFDYTMKNGSQWKAVIAAYSADEALKTLVNTVGPVRMNANSKLGRLDAISDPLREAILVGSGVDPKTKRPLDEKEKRGPGRPPKKDK